MLKVAMLIPSYGSECGVANYTELLINSLQNIGIKINVIKDLYSVFNSKSQLSGNFDLLHVQYEYVLYNSNDLRRYVNEYKKRHLPVIITIHDYDKNSVYDNWIITRIADRVIVHTEIIKSAIIDDLGYRNKIDVVPIGCDSNLVRQNNLFSAETVFNSNYYPKIGFFGFFAPQKGLISLIEAISLLVSQYPRIRLYVFASFGQPFIEISKLYYQEVLQALVRTGMEKKVEICTEYLPKNVIINRLQEMDLNILPYSMPPHLGSSMSVRDIMAARRPIIVTDIPFFSELNDEVFKISDNDPETISSNIKRILNDQDLQHALICKAHKYFNQNSWDRIARQTLNSYLKVKQLNKKSPNLNIP